MVSQTYSIERSGGLIPFELFHHYFFSIFSLVLTRSMFLMVLMFKGCCYFWWVLSIILTPFVSVAISSKAAHHIALNFTPGVIQVMVAFSVHEKQN